MPDVGPLSPPSASDLIARVAEAWLLVVAGGVAANQSIRAALDGVAEQAGLPLAAPPLRLCTDNAVMVAWAGIERLRLGLASPLDVEPRPRWGLEELTADPPA